MHSLDAPAHSSGSGEGRLGKAALEQPVHGAEYLALSIDDLLLELG